MILWSNHHNQKSLFYLSSSWLLLLQRKREIERERKSSFPRRREGVIIQIQVQDFKERPVSFLSLSFSTDTTGCSHQMQDRLRDTWERSRWWDFGRKGSQACFSCHSSVFSSLLYRLFSWFFLQSLPYNLCLKREEICSSIWVYEQSCDFIDIPRPTKSFVVWERKEGRKLRELHSSFLHYHSLWFCHSFFPRNENEMMNKESCVTSTVFQVKRSLIQTLVTGKREMINEESIGKRSRWAFHWCT